ncbi:MAG TPA: hypothetical protein VHA11_08580 [Bryobacteraceae bacterium]|nr:hypothetical protein [Bryobacteraceae bacterium]
MRSLAKLALALLPVTLPAQPLWFSVSGGEPGSWPAVLSSLGFQAQAPGQEAGILVLRPGARETAALARAEAGAFVIVEGQSEAALAAGFRPGAKTVRIQSVEDLRRPELRIIWERALDLPVFELPAQARVFTRERRTGAPLVAGFRHGAGGVLWVAADPGARGYERFPYLLHALSDLGLQPPFQSRRLWAFFDSSYRARADLDYLARRWRSSGISVLHVAAWHYFEADPQRDEYLRELIRVCHRNAILVYAWLELPHVSERFWQDHPEWREKTAVLQDAHLDWRKLMNLTNRDCFRAASAGIAALVGRFQWDGVNLAELYFESLEGAPNPSRFTPMNADVRADFRAQAGFDPVELFAGGRPTADGRRLRAFLDYRAALASRMQAEWIGEMENVRRTKPDLDMVLTHVDDRFDTGMRDLIGADAARVLPLLDQHEFTFMVEDPATVWHLGPQRYPEIARRYQALTPRTDKLAIDINIVERYQDVYPTKQQTGTELFQLLSLASRAFPRVMLYFENSILPPDVPLLPAAISAVTRVERLGPRLAIESKYGVGVPWRGAALVNGKPWPAANGEMVWLPPGLQVVEPAPAAASTGIPGRLVDFNGELKSAAALPGGMQFAYRTFSGAIAVFDRKPVRQQIDGFDAPLEWLASGDAPVVALPRGQHLVEVFFE